METIVYLVSAFVLGAGHALEPGHGKTIVGAYLVGARGRAIDAILLGVIVTLTHTSGVLALGALALFASAYFRPQDITRFLALPSGLLVLGVGLLVLRDAWRLFRPAHQAADDHGHTHDHSHDDMPVHSHSHSHAPAANTDTPPSLGLLVTLGVSGGLIPCPTALALLLAAIGAGQIAAGMVYVIVFSLGLTVVLIAVGLAMVGATAFARDRLPGHGVARWARLVSGLLVTALGVYLVAEAILYQGWFTP
jgi:ABC-type nickel/cobalt efflux system permease component RcnA